VFESSAGGRFRQVLRVPGLVGSFYRDSPGAWYALTTSSGIYRHRQGRWEPATRMNAYLRDPHADVMLRASSGELLLAGNRELVVVDETGAVRERIDLGRAGETPEAVYALLEAAPGEIWAGGTGGILVLRGAKRALLTSEDGVPGHVYGLALKTPGEIWAAGSRGVGRYRDGAWTIYDTRNGLLNEECNRALLIDSDGSVLVGTAGSLARFDPTILPLPEAPLRIVWRGLPAEDPRGIRRLGAHQRTLDLSWVAPWLGGRTVEYRTRVRQMGDAWSASGSRTELTLTNLRAGAWDVEVAARLEGSGDAGWSEPVAAHFHVAPFFWETAWAKAAGVLLGLGFVAGAIRWRTGRAIRRASWLEGVVQQRTAELELARQHLAELALRDALTGLHNRRAAEERLSQVVALVERRKVAAALFLFDIDHFKGVNDTHGHEAGDRVLAAVAECARHALRDTEFLARFGGEEFLAIFEGESEAGAAAAADRIRAAVEELRVETSGGCLRVTISGGVASAEIGTAEPGGMLAAADAALYQAKRSGRNRVCRASLHLAA
jgi:diguanylate cyclase (GGDEF)-like protein